MHFWFFLDCALTLAVCDNAWIGTVVAGSHTSDEEGPWTIPPTRRNPCVVCSAALMAELQIRVGNRLLPPLQEQSRISVLRLAKLESCKGSLQTVSWNYKRVASCEVRIV